MLAEGVETEEQMAVLTEEGCNELQGYYFGRPTTLDQITQVTVMRSASGDCAEVLGFDGTMDGSGANSSLTGHLDTAVMTA